MPKSPIPWTRVFVEGVVIVGSILLAFGIDAWWEAAGDETVRQAVIQEMLLDLEADSIDQAVMLRNAHRYHDSSAWALSHLGDAGVSQDSAAIALSPLFGVSTYQPVRAAYVGLRDSGRLHFIRDESLRSDLVRYHEMEQETQLSRVARLEARLYEVYEALELDVHRAVGEVRAETGVSAEVVRAWSDVPSDPRAVARLKALQSRARVNIVRIEELLALNSGLRRRVAAEVQD